MCNGGQSDAQLTDGPDDNALKIPILLPVGLTLWLLCNVKVLKLGFVVSTDHPSWLSQVDGNKNCPLLLWSYNLG